MAVHEYTSWGRTRSPKNLAGTQGGEVTPVESLNTLRGVTSAIGTQGYPTENQRYLHVLVEDSNEDDNETVTVYGYCHAFLRWFPLMTTIGGTTAAQSGTQEISLAGEDADLTPANQTPDLRTYRVYEIAGVDRVAFYAADASEVNIFAACSTF
jgi:hypothetical protein